MSIPKDHWLNPIWHELKAAVPDGVKVTRRQRRSGIDLQEADYGQWIGSIRKTDKGCHFAETRALTPCANTPEHHIRAGFAGETLWMDALRWLLDCRERFTPDPRPDDWPHDYGGWGRIYELACDSASGRLVYIGKTHRDAWERITAHTDILGGSDSVFMPYQWVEPSGWLKFECRLLSVHASHDETSREECRLIAETHSRSDVICLNRTSGATAGQQAERETREQKKSEQGELI